MFFEDSIVIELGHIWLAALCLHGFKVSEMARWFLMSRQGSEEFSSYHFGKARPHLVSISASLLHLKARL